MAKLNSLSLFVGTGECNARCAYCAGAPLRKYAPKEDGVIDERLILKTVRDCYSQGARYLSISSSGEPTLSPKSVTRTLELIAGLNDEGIKYSPISMYSNGIRIGTDSDFCFYYLNLWRQLGLTGIYLTVHDTDEKKNAAIYGCKSYPPLENIIFRTHLAGLKVRANLVLSKDNIGDYDRFSYIVNKLKYLGADSVSAWPIRDLNDKQDPKLSPLEADLERMEAWAKGHSSPEFKIMLLTEKNRDEYLLGHKLTLFPDGTLSNTWCN